MAANYLKKSRSFTTYRKVAWLLVPTVSIGGLFYPQLGLFMIIIMATMMTVGLFNGRYFCGNLCPHGSLFDSVLMRFSFFRKIPAFFRSKALVWFFFAYFMGMFMFRMNRAFGYWGDPKFLEVLGSVFVRQNLVWPTIGGVTFAILINPRTWCTFCPMGTMQKIMYRIGKALKLNSGTDKTITICDMDSCKKCEICSRTCPVQLEPYLNWEDNVFKDANCIKCSTCVVHCPYQLLSLKNTSEKEHYAENYLNQ
jgi:polyferredoxin